jgi:phage host-nuclease inhibitor protein Gam
MNWKEIPAMWQAAGALVAATVFVLTYHNQFVTQAEAEEKDERHQAQLILLRVDNKEAEKRTLIREKAEAVEQNDAAKAERLEQDIKTLREEIQRLCDQIEEC